MRVIRVVLTGVVFMLLSGARVHAAPAAEIILDNQDAGTSQTGTWSVSSGPNPWNGQSVYSNNGGTFRWSPTVSEAGSYEVYGWWTYHANRSSNVPFRINSADGLATVPVDQRNPSLGGQWVLLGTYTFDADGIGYVEVSSENGQASADAVRLVHLGDSPPPHPTAEIIVDNQDAGTVQAGTWSVSSGPDPWDGQSVYSNSGGTFRWSPNVSEAGSYEVYGWWTYHANRSSNVPFRIGHAYGLATVPVNQRDPSLGGQWVLLGTYNFDADGTGYVEVSSENGQASADAVRLVKLGGSVPPPPPPPPGDVTMEHNPIPERPAPGEQWLHVLSSKDGTDGIADDGDTDDDEGDGIQYHYEIQANGGKVGMGEWVPYLAYAPYADYTVVTSGTYTLPNDPDAIVRVAPGVTLTLTPGVEHGPVYAIALASETEANQTNQSSRLVIRDDPQNPTVVTVDTIAAFGGDIDIQSTQGGKIDLVFDVDINDIRDPSQILGGLVIAEGDLLVQGPQKTLHAFVTDQLGNSVIVVDQDTSTLKVGELVLFEGEIDPAFDYNVYWLHPRYTDNETLSPMPPINTELAYIADISGNTITLARGPDSRPGDSTVLKYNHKGLKAIFPQQAITFRLPEDHEIGTDDRWHHMSMHKSALHMQNVELKDGGRTKLFDTSAAKFDSFGQYTGFVGGHDFNHNGEITYNRDGDLGPDDEPNQIARYMVHSHHTLGYKDENGLGILGITWDGVSMYASPIWEGIAAGSYSHNGDLVLITDSRKGLVVHGSVARIVNSVAYGIQGASFVTGEDGNELSAGFDNNVAILAFRSRHLDSHFSPDDDVNNEPPNTLFSFPNCFWSANETGNDKDGEFFGAFKNSYCGGAGAGIVISSHPNLIKGRTFPKTWWRADVEGQSVTGAECGKVMTIFDNTDFRVSNPFPLTYSSACGSEFRFYNGVVKTFGAKAMLDSRRNNGRMLFRNMQYENLLLPRGTKVVAFFQHQGNPNYEFENVDVLNFDIGFSRLFGVTDVDIFSSGSGDSVWNNREVDVRSYNASIVKGSLDGQTNIRITGVEFTNDNSDAQHIVTNPLWFTRTDEKSDINPEQSPDEYVERHFQRHEEVIVKDYDGQPGKNFKVYFEESHPDWVLPATVTDYRNVPQSTGVYGNNTNMVNDPVMFNGELAPVGGAALTEEHINGILHPVSLSPACGNDVIDSGEMCDGNAQLCTIGSGAQASPGIHPCNSQCTGFIRACVKPEYSSHN